MSSVEQEKQPKRSIPNTAYLPTIEKKRVCETTPGSSYFVGDFIPQYQEFTLFNDRNTHPLVTQCMIKEMQASVNSSPTGEWYEVESGISQEYTREYKSVYKCVSVYKCLFEINSYYYLN